VGYGQKEDSKRVIPSTKIEERGIDALAVRLTSKGWAGARNHATGGEESNDRKRNHNNGGPKQKVKQSTKGHEAENGGNTETSEKWFRGESMKG